MTEPIRDPWMENLDKFFPTGDDVMISIGVMEDDDGLLPIISLVFMSELSDLGLPNRLIWKISVELVTGQEMISFFDKKIGPAIPFAVTEWAESHGVFCMVSEQKNVFVAEAITPTKRHIGLVFPDQNIEWQSKDISKAVFLEYVKGSYTKPPLEMKIK